MYHLPRGGPSSASYCSVAVGIAERLRELTEAERLPAPGFPAPTTASIGAAQLLAHERSIDQLMQRADQALYAAKSGGRNRVVAASWLQDATEQPSGATPVFQAVTE